MPAEPTPRTTLTQIGGWKLGRTLGRGAYAHVRLATHPNGHQAACKILPALHRPRSSGKQVSWDETIDAVEAHKEVVLLKALCGVGLQGIVGLEGVMEEGGWTYVFLTLYSCSLSSHKVPWTHRRLVTFFRRLLLVVHALHELSISHEDIKRSNVLVDEKGMPVLVDFGFSHFRPYGGKVKSAGGTLDYSSPEKTADILYDPKANDVWSLGILLTKLLQMEHPFADPSGEDTSTTIKRRIIFGDSYFDWRPEDLVSDGLASVIYGMLEPDPRKRWTIPKILQHPWLKPFHREPPLFRAPPWDRPRLDKIPESVIQDLCFLSYVSEDFRLCQTSKEIQRRLRSNEDCWEKHWARMLSAWRRIAELDWEDIPTAITPPKVRSVSSRNVKTKAGDRIPDRALREIHLSPNPHNLKPKLAGKKVQKENEPPNVPKRSRIYGMKSKEESTRKLGPAFDVEQIYHDDADEQTVASAAATKSTETAPTSLNQTRKAPPAAKTRKIAGKTVVRSNTTDLITFSSDDDSATKVAVRPALAPRRVTRVTAGTTKENPIELESSASNAIAQSSERGPAAKRGASMTKVERAKVITGSGAHPYEKRKGVPKTANAKPLRRSARLQEGQAAKVSRA
ncbi:hypothetical protein CI109_101017 [Kwoniella shandongensis]|uniref:Protein kinase domain-containing protein n=1 Tax=Kwoniella shandongensis TaxID=1734106 RepID=A0AAJ8LG84_9TREE